MEPTKKFTKLNIKDHNLLFDMGPIEIRKVSGKKGFIFPDQVLQAFNADFLDSNKCRRWVLDRVHIEGPACPYCNVVIDDGGRLQRFWSGKRLACQDCGRFFSATSQTFLAGSHMGFRKIFVALLLMAMDKKNREIAGVIGCNQETVRLWRRRLKTLSSVE